MDKKRVLELIWGFIVFAAMFILPYLYAEWCKDNPPETNIEPTVSIGTPPASESHFETYGY